MANFASAWQAASKVVYSTTLAAVSPDMLMRGARYWQEIHHEGTQKAG